MVTINRPYQCGIAVYQLAKLRMLEFYYDFLDNFFERSDFELLQMDTDSFYFAISGENLETIVKKEMRDVFEKEKVNWIVTDDFSKRTPGLFKQEFIGNRMICLSSKCYYADGKQQPKILSKGTNQNQNQMTWEIYLDALNEKMIL